MALLFGAKQSLSAINPLFLLAKGAGSGSVVNQRPDNKVSVLTTSA